MLIRWFFLNYFLIRKSWMCEYQWVKCWFSYIKVYHSFIIIRSWDLIHINETSIEFGSQSRSWINIKTNTKQKNTQTNKEKTNQNVKNKYKTKIIIHTVTFRGILNVEKNILWLFFLWFFSYRRNTYLRYYIEHRHYININSIQSMISKNRDRKILPNKGEQFGLLFSWMDFALQLRYCWTQD